MRERTNPHSRRWDEHECHRVPVVRIDATRTRQLPVSEQSSSAALNRLLLAREDEERPKFVVALGTTPAVNETVSRSHGCPAHQPPHRTHTSREDFAEWVEPHDWPQAVTAGASIHSSRPRWTRNRLPDYPAS